ncbi:MAG: ATP phosphoribosyltransferase regulatory subunit [Pseudomonadota bacterium]
MSLPETIQTLSETLSAGFMTQGAQRADPDLLQPAGPLLDLYGEDMRARAYVTHDADAGELMLRPDFTVPVALSHLQSGEQAARYVYSGPVFRMPPQGSGRPREYAQVGVEIFHGPGAAAVDTELFVAFCEALADARVTPVTGDLGILLAAIDSLEITPRRRRALRRHVWRPRRFKALFDRFAGRRPLPPGRAEVLAALEAGALKAPQAPEIGLRTWRDVEARLEHLAQDAAAAPIPKAQVEVLDAVLSLRESLPNAHEALSDIAVDLPGMSRAVDRLGARIEAFASAGLSPDTLAFETNFGRTNMEYYDGFVFGFVSEDRPDLPPVATGGRYDALLEILSPGCGQAAIGGVIRPEVLAEVAR